MKRLIPLIVVICLVGVLPLSLASQEAPISTEPTGETDMTLLSCLAGFLGAVLPEACWSFTRSCVYGGIETVIDLPKTCYEEAPYGTYFGIVGGLMSCGLLAIPCCLIGMYYDAVYY